MFADASAHQLEMKHLFVYTHPTLLAVEPTLHSLHLTSLRQAVLADIALKCDCGGGYSWVAESSCKPNYVEVDQDNNGHEVEGFEAFNIFQFENDHERDSIGYEKGRDEEDI